MPLEKDLASLDEDLHLLSNFKPSFRQMTNQSNSSHLVMSAIINKSLSPCKIQSAEAVMNQEQAQTN